MMTATELQLQEAIQDVIQELDYFEDEDVTINDWSVLDWPLVQSPYFVIITADNFDSLQDVITASTSYDIKAMLIVGLADKDWHDAYNEFRDIRQDIIDKFNAVGTARSAGGIEGVNIRNIRNLSDVGFIYPQGVDPELSPDATPDYLIQMFGFVVEQY